MKRILSLIIAAGGLLCSHAEAFRITLEEMEGSRMPYPENVAPIVYPDSLQPVTMVYVGRHGSRYPTTSKPFSRLEGVLSKASSAGALTPKGERLQALVKESMEWCDGKWGELDSLGVAELEGIARRAYRNFPSLFKKEIYISGYASQTPRCRASMDAFTHQLSLENDSLDILTMSGPATVPLLRPFTIDEAYLDYRHEEPYKEAYDAYCREMLPLSAAESWIDLKKMPLTEKEEREVVEDAYYVVSSQHAMGRDYDLGSLMDAAEMERMWKADNLRQYLTRCANRFSPIPAQVCLPLADEIFDDVEEYEQTGEKKVYLYFGHAETLMPLLSWFRFSGCWWEGDDLENLWEHWQTYNVVPMAANLQIVTFVSTTGNIYYRFYLNEKEIYLDD